MCYSSVELLASSRKNDMRIGRVSRKKSNTKLFPKKRDSTHAAFSSDSKVALNIVRFDASLGCAVLVVEMMTIHSTRVVCPVLGEFFSTDEDMGIDLRRKILSSTQQVR